MDVAEGEFRGERRLRVDGGWRRRRVGRGKRTSEGGLVFGAWVFLVGR